jgi:hypothetical protein
MILSTIQHGVLDDKATSDFESVTESFLSNQLKGLKYDIPVTFLKIQTNIESQVKVEASNRRHERQLRRLKSDPAVVRVKCSVSIEFQTDATENDVSGWIGEAYNAEDKRVTYISQLKSKSSDAFDTLENVVVLVNGAEPPQVIPVNEKSPNRSFFQNEKAWYIAGAIGGTISLLVIICTLYSIGRNKRRRAGNGEDYGNKQNMTALTKIKNQLSYDSDTSPNNKLHYTAEIDVDLHNDDVSTLGDPTYYGGAADQPTVVGGPLMQPSNHYTTAFMNNDKASKLYNPSDSRERFLSEDDTDEIFKRSDSNLSKLNDDIVVHTVIDDSADNDDNASNILNRTASTKNTNTVMKASGSKFAVEVPPGKLGMIIDTPDNGPPMVHTVKPESILCSTVQAGDLLLSVDDDNVTHMSAVQVSKLISIKSDQHRTLVFLRKPINRDRINSASSDFCVEQAGAC